MYKLLKGLEAKDSSNAPATLRQICKAIMWSFFGVRKMSSLKSDAGMLAPIQLILAGIVGCACFVIFLLLLVHHLTA